MKRGPKHRRPVALIYVLLALATVALYWPARHFEFLNYDDPDYVLANPHVLRGLSADGFLWAFKTLSSGNWHPVTSLSHMLDCQLFGRESGFHHLVNLLLHTANTLLLFGLLRRLTGAVFRSAFVAALFALHPLHVESVAWIAERKDVLSAFFGLLAFRAYARYAHPGKIKNPNSTFWYCLALALFALSLMSKPMLVTFPFLLLLIDFWPLKRLQIAALRRLLLEKLPFLLLSVADSIVTVIAQSSVGAVAGTAKLSVGERLVNGLIAYANYLRQMFWPADLAVFYPYPQTFSIVAATFAALLLVTVSVFVMRQAKNAPYLLFGWLWYLVALLPVIGFIQVGGHAHADRYTYVPLIGIFVLLTWGAADLAQRSRRRVLILSLTGVAALVLCAGFTMRQIVFWKNSESLFRHALEVTRNNYVAYYCLGLYLSDHGKSAEAMEDYRTALQFNPAYGEAYSNLGIELAINGRLDEAMNNFRDAIRCAPRFAGAHSNLGLALAMQGKLEEATKEYEESLRLNPDDARVHGNLGNALDQQGKLDEAIAHYRTAMQLDPDDPEIHVYCGIALAKQGKREEAAAQYNEALRLKPDDAEARQALDRLGRAGK